MENKKVKRAIQDEFRYRVGRVQLIANIKAYLLRHPRVLVTLHK